jgi:hypothetical protein
VFPLSENEQLYANWGSAKTDANGETHVYGWAARPTRLFIDIHGPGGTRAIDLWYGGTDWSSAEPVIIPDEDSSVITLAIAY